MNIVNAQADSLQSVSRTVDVPFTVDLPDGVRRLNLMVENIHCAGCIRKIESNLHAAPGVVRARVNMSTRRLALEWRPVEADVRALMNLVEGLGFPVAPYDPGRLSDTGAREEKRLLIALAVAGFAAGNVMLLSISIWSGHLGGMGDATRTLFHWVSALIALPAVAFSGQPFFRSAYGALANRSLNMDVPISLAVILASGMSLYQTIQGREHAYFDASVSLLFFLLIGRYLDRRARSKARSAAEHLVNLTATVAHVIAADGSVSQIAIDDIGPGMIVSVAAGERIPVDGEISRGASELDTSLVTGESLPRTVEIGDRVFAGTLNLGQPVELCVTAAGEGTLLAEIVRLMEAAEQGRAKYVRIADRVAKFYAPAVHLLAGATFLGWTLFTTAGWEASLMAAIAVLIITCPCALGLAVPVVQVVASGRLLMHGVLLKSPDGLERLAAVDTVIFDKTGTLTLGELTLVNGDGINGDDLSLAAAMARHSRHPLSRALTRAWGKAAVGIPVPEISDVSETAGSGLSTVIDGDDVRLGKSEWCGVDRTRLNPTDVHHHHVGAEIWLCREGRKPVRFVFSDTLRSDAREAIAAIRKLGLRPILISGDREAVVRDVARSLGIEDFEAECLPDDKVERVQSLTKQGHKVLMVGDGLNDAPALAAGYASISPSSAADVSQTAADIIFQGERLAPIAAAIRTARLSDRLVRENFGLAFLYNAIAIPLAVIGFATPLVAAVAMSSSSLVVTLNALRLRIMRWEVR